MARPTATLDQKYYGVDFRLHESDSPKYKFALETMHFGKPHENLDPYMPQWNTHDLAKHTGLLVSSVNAIGFKNYAVVNGEKLYAPIAVYLSIIHRAGKRKQTVKEYISAQNDAARRRNARGKQPPVDGNKVLAVIHTITKDHPKARAVFERELQKIGVALPELDTTKE